MLKYLVGAVRFCGALLVLVWIWGRVGGGLYTIRALRRWGRIKQVYDPLCNIALLGEIFALGWRASSRAMRNFWMSDSRAVDFAEQTVRVLR